VSSLKNSQRPHGDSRDLRILKIGPKEQPFGSGYNTSIRRWTMRQTELVSASRVAIVEQLSASIGEINQPISALVLNAEAALQLLLAQPTNTGAVRQLLTCIVKDGLRTGAIVRRTRALIEKAPPKGTDSPRFGAKSALRRKIDSLSLDQCGNDWTPARSRSTISSSPSRALPAQRACLLHIGPEHW
jgi:hypothetical protein